MPRRPRKLLGAFAGSIVSLTVLIEKKILQTGGKKLHNIRKRVDLFKYRMEYEGSPDDIFVVTYPKSGTTWLQMIMYQLTTDGEMNFNHITEFSPHLEVQMIPWGHKISDVRGTPRVIKSHLDYHDIPKGPGRYIYGVRNGLDVAVSYHHHARQLMPGWGQCSRGEFFSRFLEGGVPYGSWFEHVAGWLRNKDRLNVLVITYEELRADLEAGVRRIADFCGITIDPVDMPRILERCSFAFMRQHETKFALWGAPPPKPAKPAKPERSFIRKGQVGGWQDELDARAESDFQAQCDRLLRGFGEDLFQVISARSTGKPGPRSDDAGRARPTPPAGGRPLVGQSEGAPHTES